MCGCLGIGVLVAVLGGVVGAIARGLAAFVLVTSPPPTEEAQAFAALGALIGMAIGAKLGSRAKLRQLEEREEEFGGPVMWGPERRELAVRSGAGAAALGSAAGAILAGVVWFVSVTMG